MSDGFPACAWVCYEEGLDGLTSSAPVKFLQKSSGMERRIRIAVSTLTSFGNQPKDYYREPLTVEGEGFWRVGDSAPPPRNHHPTSAPKPVNIPVPPPPGPPNDGMYINDNPNMIPGFGEPVGAVDIRFTQSDTSKVKGKGKGRKRDDSRKKQDAKKGPTKLEILMGAGILFVSKHKTVIGASEYVGQEKKEGVIWKVILCLGATCAIADHRPMYKGFFSHMTATETITIVGHEGGITWKERVVPNPYFGVESFTITDKNLRRITKSAIEYVVNSRGSALNPIQDSAAVYVNKFWRNLCYIISELAKELRPNRLEEWCASDEGVPFDIVVGDDKFLRKVFEEIVHADGTVKLSDGSEVPYSDDISGDMLVSLKNWMIFFIALNPVKLRYHEGGGHPVVTYVFPLKEDLTD